MVLSLTLMMVTVMITVDIVLRLQQKRRRRLAGILTPSDNPEADADLNAMEFPRNLLFNHSHAWAMIDRATVNVGLDDFVQRLAGTIDRIETVPPGALVKKGDPLWTIFFGDRSLVQRAPVSGRVTRVNREVTGDPALINREPYGDGWILEILPHSLNEEASSLLDRKGFRVWNDKVRAQLLQETHPALGLVFGDAGQVRSGVGRLMGPEKWEQFAKLYFSDSE
jgi:glycine cleavage system H protein